MRRDHIIKWRALVTVCKGKPKTCVKPGGFLPIFSWSAQGKAHICRTGDVRDIFTSAVILPPLWDKLIKTIKNHQRAWPFYNEIWKNNSFPWFISALGDEHQSHDQVCLLLRPGTVFIGAIMDKAADGFGVRRRCLVGNALSLGSTKRNELFFCMLLDGTSSRDAQSHEAVPVNSSRKKERTLKIKTNKGAAQLF